MIIYASFIFFEVNVWSLYLSITQPLCITRTEPYFFFCIIGWEQSFNFLTPVVCTNSALFSVTYIFQMSIELSNILPLHNHCIEKRENPYIWFCHIDLLHTYTECSFLFLLLVVHYCLFRPSFLSHNHHQVWSLVAISGVSRFCVFIYLLLLVYYYLLIFYLISRSFIVAKGVSIWVCLHGVWRFSRMCTVFSSVVCWMTWKKMFFDISSKYPLIPFVALPSAPITIVIVLILFKFQHFRTLISKSR